MENLVAEFIEDVKKKSHLKSLIQNSAFSICFKIGNEEIPLRFQKGDISIHFADQNQMYDAIILGTKESIYSILTGREKLRDAINRNEVAIQTNFRQVLFLESLFYLCKN